MIKHRINRSPIWEQTCCLFLVKNQASFFVWLAYNGMSSCGIISDERKRKELVDLSEAVSWTTKSRRAVILHEVISFLSSTLHSFYLPLSSSRQSLPLCSALKKDEDWLYQHEPKVPSFDRLSLSVPWLIVRCGIKELLEWPARSFHQQYRSRETGTIFGVDDEPWSPGGKVRESREIFTRA